MPTPLIIAVEPGLAYFRKESITALQTVMEGPCAVYAYTFRNASTSPVYVNFYSRTTGIRVGGVGGSEPTIRVMVPGAVDASNPGMIIVTPDAFPLRVFHTGCSICPVLTDTDGAVVGGTITYTEIQLAAQATL